MVGALFSAPGRHTLVQRVSLDWHPQGALGRTGLGRSPQRQPLQSHLNPTSALSIAVSFTMC